MNDSNRSPPNDDPREADELLTRLLRESGRGPTASLEARARIYAAVRARWQAALDAGDRPCDDREGGVAAPAGSAARPRRPTRHAPAERGRRSRWLPRLALAASVVIAAVVFYRLEQPAPGPAASFAAVANVTGGVDIRRDGVLRPAGQGGLGSVRIGDALVSGDDGRVALRLADGRSLRLDTGTELAILTASRVELVAGGVYFDSARPDRFARAETLVIDTPLGSVRHAGTQFEASLVTRTLRIRVREGTVLFRDDDRELTAGVGEQIEIPATGMPRRTTIALDDPAWRWIEDLATLAPAGEYRLGDVLAWVARETGRELEFGSAAVEARARDVALFELEGLSPRQALDVLKRTTAFAYEDAGTVLRVTEAAPRRGPP